MRLRLALCGAALAATMLPGQTAPPIVIYRGGGDIQPPRAIHKAEPVYTATARDAHIQGTCIVEVIINPQGRAEQAALVSTLGFGLDEKALEAIREWEFEPARKAGNPVYFAAMLKVDFRLNNTDFDARENRQRTTYNLARYALSAKSEKAVEDAIATVQRLSKEKYPPAQYLEGVWLSRGDRLPKDDERAVALWEMADRKNYGPAMYELGRWRLKANPADEEAMRLIRDASTLGSPGAQFYLASLAETSDPPDLERARRLYRLCAAQGEAACQFNLANLTLNTKDLLASDKLQALAWLRLAALQRLDRARVVWSKYEPSLSKEERAAVAKLCTQLVRPG